MSIREEPHITMQYMKGNVLLIGIILIVMVMVMCYLVSRDRGDSYQDQEEKGGVRADWLYSKRRCFWHLESWAGGKSKIASSRRTQVRSGDRQKGDWRLVLTRGSSR